MNDEDVPDLDRFGHDDAWRLGSAIVALARPQDLPVVVVIWLGEQRVFHAALPGATADNDAWAARKAAIVRRFDLSTAEVKRRYDPDSTGAFYTAFGLDRALFAAEGGAVPIRVRGTQVGVLAISGILSHPTGDHDLAVEGLHALA